ncbi:MAG: FAD-binding domain-containing protein, partial [Saprospiraceae bacterium]
PIIQAEQHDAEAIFIKKWLPALRDVPAHLCYRPWEMTAMEQTFYNCRIGGQTLLSVNHEQQQTGVSVLQQYPAPIINYDQVVAKNKEIYWQLRNRPEVQEILPTVWERFCVAEDIEKYRVFQQQVAEVQELDVDDTLPF